MVRCLAQNETIRLQSGGSTTEFVIDEVLGAGGSCVAYRVSYKENGDILHRGILKEFFPAFLVNDETPVRRKAAIDVPAASVERFYEEMEAFRHTYRVINEYLANNLSAVNYHTVQLGLYEGNNTVYTLTSCDYGKSYDKLEDTDAQSLFRLMVALTKAVELYHWAGFLHLDIKPANMLVLDDVTDVVKLFDFDSLIPLRKFLDRSVRSIPMPGEYYVPELFSGNVHSIGVHTDIFEIGAIVFKRLFGRYPEPSDMEYSAVYPLDRAPLLVGASPQAKHEVEVLLRKTVQIATSRRYQTTAELKKQLEMIAKLVGSDAPYPIDLPKWQPTGHFVGRRADLQELDRRLQEDGFVFVKGIGGLGKSELVKYYVKTRSSRYHTVQFCKYEDSLKAVVASLPINGVDDSRFADIDELARQKNTILHTCDEHTLLIVDNFNVTHDKFLRDFLPADNTSFKVIFTTRCQLAADYYADNVMKLSKLSVEECKSLYTAHTGCDADNADVEALFEKIDYNTLVLVLLAQAIRKTGKTPQEIAELLDNQELDRVQTLLFHEYDYSDEEIEEYNKIYAHLNVIFDVSRMSAVEKQLLKNMSLVSPRGIGADEFLRFCECDAFSTATIETLVSTGWLEYRDDALVMHPIVSDLLFMNEIVKTDESYYRLADVLEDECYPDYRCHIRVVMDRIACALHLERRYKNEHKERQIVIKTKLGQLYMNIFRPKTARAYLQDAIALSEQEKIRDYLPYIYHIAGELEKDFGTLPEAIAFYEQAIEEGCEAEEDCSEIVAESMIAVAFCLTENGDFYGAKDAYEGALAFAQELKMDLYIYGIAKALVDVCRELDLPEEKETYAQLMRKYAQFEQECDRLPQKIKDMRQLTDSGDYTAGMREYESFLEDKREELGEESPVYQDVARERWVFYVIRGDCEQAKRLAAQALNFTEEKYGSESMEMAEQLSLIARLFPRIQEFAYAISCAERAIAICNTLGQGQSKIALEAKLSLTNAYFIQGKHDEARDAYADVDFSVFSGTEILSEIVTIAGVVLCELSEYDLVEDMCAELLRRDKVDRFSKVQANIMYAICREQKGDLEEAEYYFEQAKPLVETIVDDAVRREWLTQYHRGVARIAFRRGNYKKAITELDELYAQFPPEHKDTFVLISMFIERGLYHASEKNTEAALDDYKHAERILVANDMPAEAFVTLYNNAAVTFCNLQDFKKAKDYLDKIVTVKPSVLEPSSYTEAMVCGNIGWVAFNNGDNETAEQMLCKATKALEDIGATGLIDYLMTLHNTALVYEDQKRYGECHKLYRRLFGLYNEDAMDSDGQQRVLFAVCHIRMLLKDEDEAAARAFVTDEDAYNVRRFGENSLQRIEFLMQAGLHFKVHGSEYCMHLYETARDAVHNGGHEQTISNARLLNYIGVVYADGYEDYEAAQDIFEKAKVLFEELGETQDEMYQVVVANIEYARDKHRDAVVAQCAKVFGALFGDNAE